MRKLLHSCLLFALFMSCKKEESNSFDKEKVNIIDSLFEKALNPNFKREERLSSSYKVYNYLISQPNESLDLNKHIKLADVFYYLEDYEKYVKMQKNLLRFSKETNNISVGVKSNYGLGVFHLVKFSNDSAFYYFSKAEKLVEKNSKTFYLEEILVSKANLLFLNKDYTGSEITGINALKTALKNKNNRIVYDSYITIGNSRNGLNDFNKALEYYDKAIDKTNDLGDDPQFLSLKAQPYNYIAKILQKQGKYYSALSKVDTALKFSNFRRNDPIIYCYLTNNKAYSKFKLGYNDCLQLFNETLRIGDSLQSIPIQLTSKLYLSEYYLSKKDSLKAKYFSQEAKQLARQNKIFEDELKALELLAKIDPKNSPSYNQRYITLSDSLQSVERATRNKFARIEFETDEITNEKKVIEAENQRMAAQVLAILAFSFFVITALVLLYVVKAQRAKNRELQYKQQQQKANFEIYQLMLDQQQKIEEGKQIEKKRISRELHDGIMGKLTAIRLNLFILKKKSDPETIAHCMKYVDEIQDIEKEIRKIAHDLNQNLFADTSDFVLMVDNLVAKIKEHSNVHFTVMADEGIDWTTVASAIKIQVYRILQESLQNIGKYAQAEKVSITMLKKENSLEVSITDDGVGFNTQQTKGGIGLKNMRERAAEIGAVLKIVSEKNEGTQIILTIPT